MLFKLLKEQDFVCFFFLIDRKKYSRISIFVKEILFQFSVKIIIIISHISNVWIH